MIPSRTDIASLGLCALMNLKASSMRPASSLAVAWTVLYVPALPRTSMVEFCAIAATAKPNTSITGMVSPSDAEQAGGG
jgi:hypothetical protein